MGYTVEITLLDPPYPESEKGLATYRLSGSFVIVEHPKEAVACYIAEFDCGSKGLLFDILDHHEVAIATESVQLQMCTKGFAQ